MTRDHLIVSSDVLTANFTIVLTAGVVENGGGATGTVTDFDTDTGNPAVACTDPGFNSSTATAVYTLTWTQIAGASGEFVVTCVETFGIQHAPFRG